MNEKLRQDIQRRFEVIPAYVPIEPFEVLSERVGRSPQEIIKLDANENPYGMAPLARKALRNLAWGHIYPDPENRVLRSALADFLTLPVANLLVGAGADELIDLVMRVILRPGERVMIAPPTFGMYAFDARINSAKVIEVPRRPDFGLDLDRMEQVVEEQRPKLVFLATPNNPDGQLISPEQLSRIFSWKSLIVLDEAYIEFTDAGGRAGEKSSQARIPLERDNVIVLRTFSKWAGLAGLRVGYGIFPDWLLPALWKVKQPYNVNTAASAAAIASLQELKLLADNLARIRRERLKLLADLGQFSWLQPLPSQANFILCKVNGRSAKTVKDDLMKQGIFVRYFDTPYLQNYLRISIGRAKDRKVLIEALRNIEVVE